MPQKRQQTTYDVAVNLKAALQAKGIYNFSEGSAVYANARGEQHLAIFNMGDSSFRSITKSNNSVWFDFIDNSDIDLVRMWVYREVYIIASNYPEVSYNDFTKSGNNYTHKITYNGVDYTHTSTNVADAIAVAFTNMLNSN